MTIDDPGNQSGNLEERLVALEKLVSTETLPAGSISILQRLANVQNDLCQIFDKDPILSLFMKHLDLFDSPALKGTLPNPIIMAQVVAASDTKIDHLIDALEQLSEVQEIPKLPAVDFERLQLLKTNNARLKARILAINESVVRETQAYAEFVNQCSQLMLIIK